MKIVIPGGTGQVGHILARSFVAAGHEVVVLSRRAEAAPGWRVVAWDGATVGDWAREIDGADVVVNLAGRSVDCRYTEENRRQILASRGHLEEEQAIIFRTELEQLAAEKGMQQVTFFEARSLEEIFA